MALNLALGVQYASYQIPVHRNSLKPKVTTMASYVASNPNPASKYGALKLPSPTTTRRNLVTSRRGKRITVAAALQGNVAPAAIATIAVNLENGIGEAFNYADSKFWRGTKGEKDIPKTIADTAAQFDTKSDADGTSFAGVLYLLPNLAYWLFAWKYNPQSKENKLYTKILPSATKIGNDFWTEVYAELLRQKHDSSEDEDADLGFVAKFNVSANAKLAASFKFKQ